MKGAKFNIKNIDGVGWFNLVVGLLCTIFGFILYDPFLTFLGGMGIMIWISDGFIEKTKEVKK